jgi:hypothetical protein
MHIELYRAFVPVPVLSMVEGVLCPFCSFTCMEMANTHREGLIVIILRC